LWLIATLIGCNNQATAPASGVIVICLDTLRADRLGSNGHPGGLTPNLDRLAAESARYTNAHAQANETILSHTSLFTGRYASELGPFTDEGLPQGSSTVAGRLHAAGWETAAVVAGGHMSRAYGLHAGFDHYDDSLAWGSLADTGPRALRWLDARDNQAPFFLFIHSYDVHDRYLKPSPFGYSRAQVDHPGIGRELGRVPGAVSRVADGAWVGESVELVEWARDRPRFDRGAGAAQLPDAQSLTPADVEHLSALYDGSVAWADAALGLLLGELESRRVLDTAWLVVLSDHGHELGDKGSFHHRFALNDDTLRVPLLIRPPGGLDNGIVNSDIVELLDIAPTLLQIAGAPPDVGARGQPLWTRDGPTTPTPRAHTFAEGRLRMLSARNTAGDRLTAAGLSMDHPELVSLLQATPPGGPGLEGTGDPTAIATLHTALVDWRLMLTEQAQ